MSEQWLVVVSILLSVALVLLFFLYRKVSQQNRLIRLQSQEIETKIRELVAQNRIQQELNREKQQLIGVVSHDLKGPFNRTFALIQLMSMDGENLTDHQKEYLGKIHQITADGLNMVRNLVDARKMDDQGIDLGRENLNLVAVLSSLIKQYRVLAQKKRIDIALTAPEKLEITGDRIYLSRMIENLISNALKFSPHDKAISVELKEESDFCVLSVRDQGPGLSEEDKQKLYLKFQKLSARPTGGESSTGLGLSIVKRLIERMGGSIECQSEIEKGATFILRIPKQATIS